jgi:ribosomal protein L11 methyltransferase
MDWIKVSLQANDVDPEVMLAWVGELDFDAFETEGDVLHAYVPASRFDPVSFGEQVKEFPFGGNLRWESALIRDKNWNEAWEKQYEPVRIDQQVTIRAPFHPPAHAGDLDLVIEPKMSFGTGHHPTTTLMIRLLLKGSVRGRTVLDLGCGSGVLGILASRLGASRVTGIDIDEWAVENSRENCQRNRVDNMEIEMGDARAIGGRQFDCVLANINRNILVKEMPAITRALNPGGRLLISGFLQQDLPVIRDSGEAAGLVYEEQVTENEWAAVSFLKP